MPYYHNDCHGEIIAVNITIPVLGHKPQQIQVLKCSQCGHTNPLMYQAPRSSPAALATFRQQYAEQIAAAKTANG